VCSWLDAAAPIDTSVISALPSKEALPIFRAVASFVAVVAAPPAEEEPA